MFAQGRKLTLGNLLAAGAALGSAVAVLRGRSARGAAQLAPPEDETTALQRTIAEITSAMASARTVREVAGAALTGIADSVSAVFGSVRIVDAATERWSFVATYGMTGTLNRVWHVYADNPDAPVNRLMRTRRRLTVTKADYAAHYPKIATQTEALGVEAIVYVPVVRAGSVTAVITVGLREAAGAALARTKSTLDTLAPIIAEALQRAQLFESERSIASALQTAMLGRGETDDERVSLAARYRAAAQELFVGGDWYDFIELANDRIAVIVGDAVGHGVEATAAMGQLRSAAAGLALAVDDPAVLMEQLEHFARRTPSALCATCLVVIIDPAAERLQYVSAGHPPAVVLKPDGTTAVLDAQQGPPLAAGLIDRRRHCGEHELPVGSTVVLYTDGLVERRDESLDRGFERLRDVADRVRGESVDDLCEDVLAGMLGERGNADDVALVAVRLERTHSHRFVRRLHSDSAATAALRHELEEWLARWEVPPWQSDEVVTAVGEAVANSIEHAYANADAGVIVVDARIDDELLAVRVSDHGAWREPVFDPTRGRGRGLMEAFSDQFETRKEPVGTTVLLTFERDCTGTAR